MSDPVITNVVANILRDETVLAMQKEIEELREELHNKFKVEIFVTVDGKKILLATGNMKQGCFVYDFPSLRRLDLYTLVPKATYRTWMPLSALASLELFVGGAQYDSDWRRVYVEDGILQLFGDGPRTDGIQIFVRGIQRENFAGSFRSLMHMSPHAVVAFEESPRCRLIFEELKQKNYALFSCLEAAATPSHLKIIADNLLLDGTYSEMSEERVKRAFFFIVEAANILGYFKLDPDTVEKNLKTLVDWIKLSTKENIDRRRILEEFYRCVLEVAAGNDVLEDFYHCSLKAAAAKDSDKPSTG